MQWRKNWFVWLCFLGMFAAVAGALGPDFLSALRSYTWTSAPCTILQSRIVQEPFSRAVTHFVLKVEYRYKFNDREYRSTRFTTGNRQGSADARIADQAETRFAPGTRAS